ncbi:Uncharacterised protein [Mycobacterium tuberculosis]|nr:Uncharacterised protein [Mycobacterium tuberculosis]
MHQVAECRREGLAIRSMAREKAAEPSKLSIYFFSCPDKNLGIKTWEKCCYALAFGLYDETKITIIGKQYYPDVYKLTRLWVREKPQN